MHDSSLRQPRLWPSMAGTVRLVDPSSRLTHANAFLALQPEAVFEINRVKEILPHRYPFLLVDKVIEFEAGKRAVGIKKVTANEEFFNGHFPNRPIMPGVLQVPLRWAPEWASLEPRRWRAFTRGTSSLAKRRMQPRCDDVHQLAPPPPTRATHS